MSFPECQLDVCLRQAAVRKAAENSGHLTARPLGTFKMGADGGKQQCQWVGWGLTSCALVEVEYGGHGGWAVADQGKGWRIHRLMCDLSGLRRPWSGSLEALQQPGALLDLVLLFKWPSLQNRHGQLRHRMLRHHWGTSPHHLARTTPATPNQFRHQDNGLMAKLRLSIFNKSELEMYKMVPETWRFLSTFSV